MNTVLVKKGGSFLDIPVESIDRYMSKGYDVVDNEGNVLKACIPNDINVLRNAYSQHLDEIKNLKNRIKELETEIARKSASTEKTIEKPAETKPSTARRSKK